MCVFCLQVSSAVGGGGNNVLWSVSMKYCVCCLLWGGWGGNNVFIVCVHEVHNLRMTSHSHLYVDMCYSAMSHLYFNTCYATMWGGFGWGGVGWAKNVLALVYLLHIFFACAIHLGWVWVVGWVGQITSLLLRTCYKLTKLPATLRYHLIDAIGHKNFFRLRATLCCFLLYFLNNFQLR